MRSLVAVVVVSLVVGTSAGKSGAAAFPDPGAARAYLATIRPDPELQTFLDRSVEALMVGDPALRRAQVGIALLDLPQDGPPRLAHRGGDTAIYPASVVKLVYLMAAYAWQERGRLTIDPGLDAELEAMIRESSNRATQKVFARITGTSPGPNLSAAEYPAFRERRLAVKRWLQELGIDDLHCVNPTYDGDGDLAGRDQQFLRDRTVKGGLASADGTYPNRQAMTAIGTAKLLALLATDRALTPEDSATVRRRMKRDPKQQPYLARRIAGGAARIPGLEVYAKSGTWGPNYADAGIVRHPDGRQFVLVVYTEAEPAYRGEVIAQLTYRAANHLFSTTSKSGTTKPSTTADRHDALPRNWPMAPSALDYRLAFEDFEIREVKHAGAGVTGALRLLIAFPDGEELKIKWKPFPKGELDGWNNSPRKEFATYRIQRWLFDEQDYVVPTPVPRCLSLERYRAIDPNATPSVPGTRCVLGLAVVWMNDVEVVDDLDEDDRLGSDEHFTDHLADMNLVTYLVNHRDGREGNFLISKDPSEPRVFAIDNGISFEGFPWNFFVKNWNTIRVPWLRRDPVERLRALPPEEVDRLASLFDMEADANGILQLRQPSAPIDPDEGVRVRSGRAQFGLTAQEIDRLRERIRDLLADVDAGKLPLR
jgi:beta-lactamase class A